MAGLPGTPSLARWVFAAAVAAGLLVAPLWLIEEDVSGARARRRLFNTDMTSRNVQMPLSLTVRSDTYNETCDHRSDNFTFKNRDELKERQELRDVASDVGMLHWLWTWVKLLIPIFLAPKIPIPDSCDWRETFRGDHTFYKEPNGFDISLQDMELAALIFLKPKKKDIMSMSVDDVKVGWYQPTPPPQEGGSPTERPRSSESSFVSERTSASPRVSPIASEGSNEISLEQAQQTFSDMKSILAASQEFEEQVLDADARTKAHGFCETSAFFVKTKLSVGCPPSHHIKTKVVQYVEMRLSRPVVVIPGILHSCWSHRVQMLLFLAQTFQFGTEMFLFAYFSRPYMSEMYTARWFVLTFRVELLNPVWNKVMRGIVTFYRGDCYFRGVSKEDVKGVRAIYMTVPAAFVIASPIVLVYLPALIMVLVVIVSGFALAVLPFFCWQVCPWTPAAASTADASLGEPSSPLRSFSHSPLHPAAAQRLLARARRTNRLLRWFWWFCLGALCIFSPLAVSKLFHGLSADTYLCTQSHYVFYDLEAPLGYVDSGLGFVAACVASLAVVLFINGCHVCGLEKLILPETLLRIWLRNSQPMPAHMWIWRDLKSSREQQRLEEEGHRFAWGMSMLNRRADEGRRKLVSGMSRQLECMRRSIDEDGELEEEPSERDCLERCAQGGLPGCPELCLPGCECSSTRWRYSREVSDGDEDEDGSSGESSSGGQFSCP